MNEIEKLQADLLRVTEERNAARQKARQVEFELGLLRDGGAEKRIAELERELDEAWNATGVAGAVRGLTTLADVVATNRKDRDGLEAALQKINAIRNDIVGMQGVSFSRHIYPLVAALNEAGIDGAGYTEARAALVKEMADEKVEREHVAGLESALRELVTLKDDVKQRDPADYERRKPAAWDAARAALSEVRP